MKFEDISGKAIALVVIGMIIGFGALVLVETQTEIVALSSNTSVAYNATEYALEGMETFGSWLPLIVLVIVAVIIIALLVSGFGGGRV